MNADDTATAALTRVRDLHSKAIGQYVDNDGCRWTGENCLHCKCEWPCRTIEAIDRLCWVGN